VPLRGPVGEARFAAETVPLWVFQGQMHPNLRRKGRILPANSADLRRLTAGNETSTGGSFDPAAAPAAASHRLPTAIVMCRRLAADRQRGRWRRETAADPSRRRNITARTGLYLIERE